MSRSSAAAAVLAACTFAAALAAAPTAARADDAAVAAAITRARTDRAALRYREALDGAEAALGLGRASPAQLAELYRLAGEVAAGLDEPSAAQRWFARWLALVPDARLPADASPKLLTPLAAARAQLGGRALTLDVAAEAGTTLRITAHGDALGLVRRVRLRSTDGSIATQDGLPGAAFAVAAATTGLVAAGLDEHGNEVVTRPVAAPPPLPPPSPPPPPLLARWQTWTLATGALAIAGGTFAWRTGVAQDQFDSLKANSLTTPRSFDELERVRRRGERYALATNVGFGAAAASAVVTVVLFVRHRDDGERLTVAPIAAPGHAGVALTGWF